MDRRVSKTLALVCGPRQHHRDRDCGHLPRAASRFLEVQPWRGSPFPAIQGLRLQRHLRATPPQGGPGHGPRSSWAVAVCTPGGKSAQSCVAWTRLEVGTPGLRRLRRRARVSRVSRLHRAPGMGVPPSPPSPRTNPSRSPPLLGPGRGVKGLNLGRQGEAGGEQLQTGAARPVGEIPAETS